MDWSIAQEFQNEGVTEAMIIDYSSKHRHGLYVCGILTEKVGWD